jgi:hypothetical protein
MTISFVKRIALSVVVTPYWATRLSGIRDARRDKGRISAAYVYERRGVRL